MRENLLLNKVYTKFHKVLFDQKSNGIAVSFPEYKVLLGRKLRIHGAQTKLTALEKENWLGGLKGYCVVSAVTIVPEVVQYRIVSRKQSNMTSAKLRRLIKRGTISDEEVKTYRAKMFSIGLDNPYLEIESASNGHLHRRYIQISDSLKTPVNGEFDEFGLSKTATVPWF